MSSHRSSSSSLPECWIARNRRNPSTALVRHPSHAEHRHLAEHQRRGLVRPQPRRPDEQRTGHHPEHQPVDRRLQVLVLRTAPRTAGGGRTASRRGAAAACPDITSSQSRSRRQQPPHQPPRGEPPQEELPAVRLQHLHQVERRVHQPGRPLQHHQHLEQQRQRRRQQDVVAADRLGQVVRARRRAGTGRAASPSRTPAARPPRSGGRPASNCGGTSPTCIIRSVSDAGSLRHDRHHRRLDLARAAGRRPARPCRTSSSPITPPGRGPRTFPGCGSAW